MMETVLITSGNGFVAGWCIRTLLQRGYGVRTTVRNSAKEVPTRQAFADAGSSERLVFFTAELAELHIRAMSSPLAAGQRFVVDCARSLLATSSS